MNFIRGNRENPFFLYVPYTIPHAAFQVPELGRYADLPWPPVKKVIAAMISRMDGDVGKILELIKSLGLEENTLVIFASDNGSAGGALLDEFKGSGPLRDSKGTLYEGGIRAPMIARWPEKIAPGTTSAHICAFQDMMPTFAELASVTIPGRTDGISIVPTLLGKARQKRHEYLYWELKDNRAVRMGNFKAVKTKAGLELFDLSKDIGEKANIAARHPDVIEKIRTIIETSREDSPFFTWQYSGPPPKKATPNKTRKRKSRKN